MRSLIPTKKNNPCLVCEDTRGKCRTSTIDDTYAQCMNLTGDIPGFHSIGPTRDGNWWQYRLAAGDRPATDDYISEMLERREQLAKQKAEQQAASLPAAERDRHYRQLLEELPLTQEDRAELHGRGLTDDQIKAWGVKSVKQWQRLERELPHTLPGVNLDGKSLNIPGAGYLCPAPDVDGNLVAFQIRLREPGEGARYLWMTGATKKRTNGPTPHLPNGELPLAVHRPAQATRKAIALVEGIGAKPFKLSQLLEVVTVGAAGGQFASSPKTFRHTLSQLSEELGTNRIEFFPDAGAVKNPHVLRQYRAALELLAAWEYQISIAWWGQFEKGQPDIDELEDLGSIQFISPEQFWTLVETASDRPITSETVSEVGPDLTHLQWLEEQDRVEQAQVAETQFHKIIRLFTGKRKKQATTAPRVQAAAPDSFDGIEYNEGDRLQAWQDAVNSGAKYILDVSATGGGKSFDAGLTEPASFGVERVIFLSDEHRNPTVSTLTKDNGWGHLEARHDGLTAEKSPDGSVRWRRRKGNAVPNKPGNCNRVKLAAALRLKNIQGSDTANVLCGGCPLREACTHGSGHNFGHLHQRHQVLGMPRFRAHPDSMPPVDSDDYAYPKTMLIWDEPGRIFSTQHEVIVTPGDVTQLMGYLAVKDALLLQQFQPLFTWLLQFFSGQQSFQLGKYGMSHAEILEGLPDLTGINVARLEKALEDRLDFLNPTAEHGVDLQDLSPSVRKKFADRDSEAAQKIEQNLPKRWLSEFLRIVSGAMKGSLRLTNWDLTLTYGSDRHSAIAKAAKANIFLDATETREDLALKLGCNPDEILVMRQRQPPQDNLKITQVTDLGRMGMQRGKDQQRRAAAIVSYYKDIDPDGTAVIDFKKLQEETGADGAWWSDSRGVNSFIKTRRLIVVGTPCQNLASLLAEFSTLTGITSMEDKSFQAYVERTIRAEIIQAIGRLRAHRRPGEELEVILLSDFALDIPTRQVKASDITPEAAGKLERVEIAIRGAVTKLRALGQKVTQTAIAALTGYSQQHISRFRNLLFLLLDNFNSKKSKKTEPTPEQAELEAATVSALNEAAAGEALGLEDIEQVFFEWLPPASWSRVWSQMTAIAQTKVLETLFSILPWEQVSQIGTVALSPVGGDA